MYSHKYSDPRGASQLPFLAILDMVFGRVGSAIALAYSTVSVVVAAPPGLPTSGNGIWFTEPGCGFDFWADDWLPVGNGYLAGQYNDVIFGLGF